MGRGEETPQGSMVFRLGCGWDGEQRDECVKGGQLFKEQSEQQSCG